MNSQRIAKWDNVKCFLICCVVMSHIGDFYAGTDYFLRCVQFWVHLFCMPAFIFVSGLFSKTTVNQRKWNKVIPYIFLFILMKTLDYFITVYLYGFENASLNLFYELGVPWFALALFWCYTITILVQNISPAYVLMISICLSMICGYSSSTTVNSFLVLHRTVVFYPFFYLGYMLDIEKLSSVLSKLYIKVASAIIILISMIFVYLKCDTIVFWRSLFRGRFLYKEITDLYNPVFGGCWRFVFYGISLLLTLAVLSVIPSFKSPMSWIGQRTLSVYAFHNLVLRLFLGANVGLREWFEGSHIRVHSVLLCLFIVLTTSLPIFERALRKLMNPPLKTR